MWGGNCSAANPQRASRATPKGTQKAETVKVHRYHIIDLRAGEDTRLGCLFGFSVRILRSMRRVSMDGPWLDSRRDVAGRA